MRIAMLGQKGLPARSGGVEQHVDVLARQLVERGHEVIGYSRRSYCGREAQTERQGGLHRVIRPSIPTKHLDAVTHTLAATIDVALRRADVVHYHAIGPAALAPLARLAGLPVVATVHGLDWQRAKWGKVARYCLQAGERVAAKAANRLIVVSPLLQDYFSRHHGVESHFIPNGVMPLEYREVEHVPRLGLRVGKYALAVARLVPEKGLHYLMEAADALPDDWKVVVAGGGGLDADYEQHVRRMASDRVVLLGPTERDLLAELYSHAGMFVLPSDLEGMSIALLEAMSMGAPTLASDIPENRWLVEGAGHLFAAGNVADLRGQLERLTRDSGLRRRYVEVARERVGQFQWDAIADQLEHVYAKCAGITLRQPTKRRVEERPQVVSSARVAGGNVAVGNGWR